MEMALRLFRVGFRSLSAAGPEHPQYRPTLAGRDCFVSKGVFLVADGGVSQHLLTLAVTEGIVHLSPLLLILKEKGSLPVKLIHKHQI